jgi:hypothetical protein
MRDLALLANLAEILGAIIVVAGVVFAVIQIRLFRRQRLETAAIEVLRSWQSPEFTRAFCVIPQLTDGISAAKLRAQSPECESLAMIIGNTFQSFGVMVYRRIVPLALVDELLGGAVVLLWRKLATWLVDSRKEQSRETVYEWFQWLAERLQEQPGFDMLEGAHVKHRDWAP